MSERTGPRLSRPEHAGSKLSTAARAAPGADVIDLSPIRRTVTVPLALEAAFQLFTAGMSTWWPLRTHSMGEEHAREAVFEGKVGGRIYERMDDGSEADWGRVLAWEPPTRLVFSWQPNREPPAPTEVEVRFSLETPGRTRLELEHRHWERIGDRAGQGRPAYASDGGWDMVLGEFVRVATPA
ncbi:MAG: SRPBCC domain-containing protein [Chloroflexi bacterium]|nr:SRPBCC domain-containing protein [Chloroflexota bacterium]